MSAKRKAESDSRAANRLHIMKSHNNSRADSERDSGFSDASSEHTSTVDNTDSEDSPRPSVQQGAQSSTSGQLAVVGGSYSSMSPMIIMNNMLLKQPRDNPPAMKPWSFSPAMEVVQPVVQPTQVVFLQPVVSRQSSKEASRHRRPKNYLPILKSYPKIAPHPGDNSSLGRGTASSSPSLSSSLSTSSASGSQRDHGPKEKLQKSQSETSFLSGTPNNTQPPQTQLLQIASEAPSPAVSQSESSPSFSSLPPSCASSPTPLDSASSAEHKWDNDDMRRKRFCNTYNILSKSGLLDITLRTKELLRQNRRTQSDLERLREHTDLFLQALRSGDTGICVKLHASLHEEEKEDKKRASLTSLKDD
ncbi:CLOCK-interacting pacemaker [Hippocampus comes]|uniref:CLOCK-interacting pacemaker b n=1 Tax=Hippocampus comes TaxID=109280 RepID=A0A3Q2Z1B1_HIPCM|nr:PREDICTED: CLOCK-interacting pacemaker [Hippocampus comes]XP_019737820.1 PREDICTED: CLOCK-interacting pacemaker [Hippocampus comes]